MSPREAQEQWHLEHAGSLLDMGSEVIQLVSDNILSEGLSSQTRTSTL